MRPKDLGYSQTHEWVRVDGPIAVIGLTDHALDQLSDLVHIELPPVGTVLLRGSAFGEIESVKAVSDIVSPVSGEVVEVNEAILDDLDAMYGEAYGDGWLVKVRMRDPSECERLLSAADYDARIGE